MRAGLAVLVSVFLLGVASSAHAAVASFTATLTFFDGDGSGGFHSSGVGGLR